MTDDLFPYGVFDLTPQTIIDPGPPTRIRCFIRGCEQMVMPPSRFYYGEACPEHGIRCHTSRTYSYPDVRRNFIVAQDLLASRIIGHPGKFESHRLGLEKSEDAVTFNVFRSFQEAGCLKDIASFVTGREIYEEPRLYLWGLDMTDDSLEVMPLLRDARQRFESSLPVKRPATEPDIMLFLDGQFLILCEAKLSSPNTFYFEGPRKDPQSLTKSELVEIYTDSCCQILDLPAVREANAVPYQFHRNLIFAEWMANRASSGTKAYFANLVRAGCEIESFEFFFQFVRPEYHDRVSRLRWEDLFTLAGIRGAKLANLRHYLASKTVNLTPAFQILNW